MRRLRRVVVRAGLLTLGAWGAALTLAACGGSDHGRPASPTSLDATLARQLGGFRDPPLTACATAQLHALPARTLARLASPTAAASLPQQFLGFAATCVSRGRGDGPVRTLAGQQLTRALRGRLRSLPSAYRACVARGAGTLADSDLAAILRASRSPTTAAAEAADLGRRLGVRCLRTPAVAAAVRALYVAPIERALVAHSYSSAFRTCVATQARGVPAATLATIATRVVDDRPAGRARASALGSAWAKRCIESGAAP